MRRALALLAVVPWAWCVLVAALDRRHRLSLDDVEPLTDGPLVSVIVPARDEERGVQAAIASLAAQEYGAFEVIVVGVPSGVRPRTRNVAPVHRRRHPSRPRHDRASAQVAARGASNEVCPTPRRTWPLFPVGALSLSVLSLVSSAGRLRGGVVWRGRRYEPETLPAPSDSTARVLPARRGSGRSHVRRRPPR